MMMKTFVSLAALIGSATAFAPASQQVRILRMDEETCANITYIPPPPPQTTTSTSTTTTLDATDMKAMAGATAPLGAFDPLGLSGLGDETMNWFQAAYVHRRRRCRCRRL